MKINFTRTEVIELMEFLDSRSTKDVFETYEEELDDYLEYKKIRKS